MKQSIKLFLGFVISGVCLWLVLRNVEIGKIINEIRNSSPLWFIPGFLVLLTNMILRSLRWAVILSSLKPVSTLETLPHLVFGFFMNNVLPARAGEALRAASLARQQKISFSAVIGTVFFERLFDLSGFFAVVLLSSTLLPWSLLPVSKLAIAFIVGVIGLGFVVAFRQRLTVFAATRGGLAGKISTFITDATASFVTLRSGKKMFGVFGLSMIIWFNELLQVFFIAHAMRLPLSLLESAAVLTGLSVGVMLPAAPGFVGTYEFFGNQMLLFLGKDPVRSISFVFALHGYQLVSMCGLGVLSMYFVSRANKTNSVAEPLVQA